MEGYPHRSKNVLKFARYLKDKIGKDYNNHVP